MKNKNYSDFNLTDFLTDEDFRLWVLSPDENGSKFWNRWIALHPDKESTVLKAREIIASLKFPVANDLSEDDRNKTLDLILKGQHSITNDAMQSKVGSTHTLISSYKLAIAASVLTVLSTVFYLSYEQVIGNQSPSDVSAVQMIIKKSSFGQKITTRLPDGTVVTLNAGSELQFPDQFQGDSRNVSLKGEAFFDVKHNPEKPFLVHTSDDQVRVLGTSFNIRSYSEDSAVFVSVATGRVAYSIPSGDQVILSPNQMATHNLSKNNLHVGEVDYLQSFGWKDKIIYFKSASLDDIIVELERWYGVKIALNGEFGSAGRFTGRFENLPLEEVLIGLSYEFEFN
ncbi:MAG: FecR domain-containing protein, partial [Cyclobacteriaceae bacterium]